MEMQVFEFEFTPDADALLLRMGLQRDSDEAGDFLTLLDQALKVARPMGALGGVGVDSLDKDGRVVLGGVEFKSSLLAKNLDGVETLWPYLFTCGRELYDFAMSIPDPFERFWVDEMMQQALNGVRTGMEKYLAENLYSGKTARMGPGSLPEWPIGQQVPLFRLFGDAARRCGVTLTDTMLMIPNKSVSGVYFPNEHGYVNCRLCPKEKCPNRRAAYDAELALSGS